MVVAGGAMYLDIDLQQTFAGALAGFTADEQLVAKLWQEIESGYSSEKRYYHNLKHLAHMLLRLQDVRQELTNWQAVVLALFYHDLVYNPQRHDNEEQSAAVAQERLKQAGLPEEMLMQVRELILATKGHHRSTSHDTNLFTDADLSILGSDQNAYAAYAAAIRKEYAAIPDPFYLPGRRNVLQQFLNMDSIFKTETFREKYEKQARQNLARELKELQ